MTTTTITTTLGKTTTTLGKEEQVIREDSFTFNLIFFWLKANYTLTNKRLTGHTPNTIFGVIPFGKSQVDQPLKAVASVYSSTKFHRKRLFFGLVLIILGIFMFDFSLIVGIIIGVLGLVKVLHCYTATFIVRNNGGLAKGYELSLLEKSKVENLVNQMNTVIADL